MIPVGYGQYNFEVQFLAVLQLEEELLAVAYFSDIVKNLDSKLEPTRQSVVEHFFVLVEQLILTLHGLCSKGSHIPAVETVLRCTLQECLLPAALAVQ